MPTYTVRDPKSGQTVRLTGDSPPTAAELEQIFGRLNQSAAQTPSGPLSQPATLGHVLNASPSAPILKSALGIAKGVGRTAFGLGKIVHDYTPIGRVSDAIQPGAFDQMPDELQARGMLERLGMTAEQIAEFMLLPAATKGPMLARMAVQAGESGLLTKAQGGTGRDVLASGLMSAAMPLASAVGGLVRGAGETLQHSAAKNVSQAFDPTGKRDKVLVQQITPQVLDRGLWTATKEGMQRKAGQALDALSDQYDEAAATIAPGDRLAVDQVRQPIQDAMAALVQRGSAGTPVPTNPTKYAALKELDDTLGQLGDKVSHDSLKAFKEEWDDIVAKGGGYAERTGDALTQSSLWAKRKGADAIRRVLAQDAPNIDALNAEWRFWSTVDEVVSNTLDRTRPQKGALRRVAGMAGAAVGATQGGPIGAGTGAAVGSQLMRAMDSPGWKLLSAHAKTKLAEALMSSNPERIAQVTGRVLASLPAQYRSVQPVSSH